jgi:hypothetical protein
MPDAGARRIKALIDEPSGTLAGLTQALAKAMWQAQNDEKLTVPTSALRAVDDLRRYYRDLSRKVASISTRASAKEDVLVALGIADKSLASLRKGLTQGATKQATISFNQAHDGNHVVASMLTRASRKLA